MKNQQRFAEIEYCLDKYFQANLAPVMMHIQKDLTGKQEEEREQYKSSFAGVVSGMADAAQVAPGIDSAAVHIQITGQWNRKTVDDYLAMCQKDIAGNTAIQKDLETLSAEWRKAVVEEIGRGHYDQISKQLGSDLAYAYVDYRVQQQMIQHMVDKGTPKNTAEYVLKKAASGSLIGLGSAMQQTPLAHEIADRAEKAYHPSMTEKATARGLSFGMDVVSTGCVGSWASIGKFAATEIVFDGIELATEKLRDKDKTMTVELCISQTVFSSEKNVFPDLRKQEKTVTAWDNDYVKSVNNQLEKKMEITTTKTPLMDMEEAHQSQLQTAMNTPFQNLVEDTKQQEELRQKYHIPAFVAPNKEQEYIQSLVSNQAKEQKPGQNTQEQTAAPQTNVLEATDATSNQTYPQSQSPEQTMVQNPNQDNSSGWEKILGSFGFNGLGDIGHNLGYVISMLPDILVGMWTGKTKSIDLKDNLMPYASVLAGMFVKNPILKMLLIGMGGANLLNKAGHEALAKGNGESRPLASPQYLRYADQPLNPRISDVTLSGSTLIATIDRVPCTVRLTQDVVDAYRSGALPLNTLANTILERNEQRQVVMDTNYERLQELQRQQQVTIK